MRRLLCLLALVLVAVPASAQVSSITTTVLINSSTGGNPSVTSGGNLTTTNGALQLILVSFADTEPESTISSITCTCFTNSAEVVTADGTGVRVAIWRAVGNGGAAQVTATMSGNTSNFEMSVLEVIGANSGNNYADAMLQTSTGTEATTTTCDVPALSAITAGSAVVMLCTTAVNTTTFTADMGWTEAGGETGNSSPSITHAALYALPTVSDTTPTGTWGASGVSRGLAVEIGQAPAAAGCGRSLLLGVGC